MAPDIAHIISLKHKLEEKSNKQKNPQFSFSDRSELLCSPLT